jgi:predicted ATPase/class 3 adenylate cyclase/tRNA A-37 threonylcarbamoyl transferase component Bud32
MRSISGYQIIEQLYESENSLVYRGRRLSDDQPVILKLLKEAYPSPEMIAWFTREYEVTRDLKLVGVASAYALETDQHQWVMVLEDFGGESLRRLGLIGKVHLEEFLAIAIEVTEFLGYIHQQNIMHKDINPANIVYNPVTKEVKLIDFGIATVLTRENPTFRNPNVLEGTLAYMSPEQTGRMNRAMDYRTDFYSLGVTFYELLSGRLPFLTDDVLEMVHCHIAKQPSPPHEVRPDIPRAVSDIILKLMTKNAEDRYQSAFGLKTDLENCLHQLRTSGTIEPFEPGQYDLSDRFLIPQKLYGREDEIATLLAAFERVSAGTSEMMLVTGYAGIGKSALVQELYKPMTHRRGYLIAGKFDQFQRDTPYAGFIQACRGLMRQILTESEEQIIAWQEKLRTALGSNGQVIIEVIPEVEFVIGPQPDVVVLGPAEAQNRFNLVFLDFISVFTRPEHPLVVFLDDLQWADGASLKLIELLMTASSSQYLFLIGAYRDNEVDAGHPLSLTLSAMHYAAAKMNTIALVPLDIPAVTRMVSETLHCTPEQAYALAEMVHIKTGGNPFFINEFLKSLYVEELITFDYTRGRWQWDLDQIQAQEMTDNVVELMAGKIQQLADHTQAVMKLASCIGNQFDLMTLAMASQKLPGETAHDLSEALTEGLVLPLGDSYKLMALDVPGLEYELTADYKFAHDRIQQAVYSLIPEQDREEVHWRLGQLFLQNILPESQEERIFDIVNQLNQGRAFITTQAERLDVVELNLLAGKKAKSSAAYEPAFRYLRIAVELLGDDTWQSHYDLTLDLYTEAAEAAYLTGDFDEMERLAAVVLDHARTILDKVKVYESRIQSFTAQSKQMEAVQTALDVLKMLGVSFPDHPGPDDIMRGLEETRTALAGNRIEDLYNLPEMTDPDKLAAMRIMTIVVNAAYVAVPELMSLITFKMVYISVTYGYTSVSAHAYASYGLILCGESDEAIGDIEYGYRFGQLALRLLERFNAKELKPRTLMVVNNFIRHWKEHVRETLQPLLEAYQTGMETGDLVFAAIALYVYSSLSFFTGKQLSRLEQEMASYNDILSRIKQARALYMNGLYRQVVLNLMGKSANTCKLVGTSYNEDTMLPIHTEANDRTAIYYVHFNKLILCYLFQDYEEAARHAAIAEQYSRSAVGSFAIVLFHFYDALAQLAIFHTVRRAEQKRILEKVGVHQEKIRTWANYAPMNHLHKYYIIEAELARVNYRDGEAREWYDKAIAMAQENKYLNEEALAQELAFMFYMAKGLPKLAQPYLRDAHYAYMRWGAQAKVSDLENRYAHLLFQSDSGRGDANSSSTTTTRTTTTTSTGHTTSNILDLPSVLKASQAISGEIVLDSLLSKMMRILIENAGAERGVLILDKDGAWAIEAEGTIESEEVTVLQSIFLDATSNVPLPLSVINYVVRTRQTIVLSDATQEGQFMQDPYIVTRSPRSILVTPLLNQGKLIGLLYLENNLTSGAFTSDRLELLNLLSSQVAISIENARLYNNLQESLDRQVTLTRAYSRFVPREILQFLGRESIIQVKLGDQIQQEMTVLFSDIRSFTSLSEQMTPQENFDFINAYLSRVSPIIREHNGFIDKYIGDAIMALFPGKVDDALQAAVEMQQAVAIYNKHRSNSGYQPISIGVGLHHGKVMLGTVGEAERMEGTVISDTVNLASRLEGLTKLYGSSIIISESVLFRLNQPDKYTFFFLDQVKVKGKKDPVSIFEILDGCPEDVIELKLNARADFDRGLFLYHGQQFEEAIVHFQQALRIYPDDKASQIYLQRATYFLEHGVPGDWEGIEALTDK